MDKEAQAREGFRRLYLKARKIHSRMVATEAELSFSISFEREIGTQFSLRLPDERDLMPFVVIMRQFLNRESPVYFEKIWALLRPAVEREIGEQEVVKSAASMKTIRQGPMKFTWNGDEVTAEQFYDILAEGEFFANIESARATCRRILDDDALRYFAWFQFSNYNFDVYKFLSWLYAVVFRSRPSGSRQQAIQGQCIFCLGMAGPFTSREHTFPEALGNYFLMLPMGWACDSCNNRNSKFEGALLDLPEIALRRVPQVPFTSKGKLPSAVVAGLRVRQLAPLRTFVGRADGANQRVTEKDLLDALARARRPNMIDVGRALYKIALCALAHEAGYQVVCDSQYNAARRYIAGQSNFPNRLGMWVEPIAKPGVEAIVRPLAEGTLVHAQIFGVHFFLNLEPQPVLMRQPELVPPGATIHNLA